ncbi:MAG TPA: copper chaperone PCu(A)C [Steroidobacteraceae bacterium]|nr:copper chaperone PCu(A)C [Steroidobacteraceae bacterium]
MRGANSLLVLGAAVAVLASPLSAQAGAPAGTLTVADAWVRAVPGAAVAAAYMRLHNGGTQPVRVIGVRSALAGHAMIHETRLENGVSTMRPHEPLVIAPGASVVLEPGGLHVMLHDLAHPLAVDEQVPLELLLEGGGLVAVKARVRPLSGQ